MQKLKSENITIQTLCTGLPQIEKSSAPVDI